MQPRTMCYLRGIRLFVGLLQRTGSETVDGALKFQVQIVPVEPRPVKNNGRHVISDPVPWHGSQTPWRCG